MDNDFTPVKDKTPKPMSRTKKILLIALVIVLICLSFGGGYLTYYLTLSENKKTVNWVIDMIDRNYLVYDEETGKVKKFTPDDYAKAISALLDPYSTYYSREEYVDMIQTSHGNYYGVGVSFLRGGDLTIFDVSGNSPAERAGIKKNGVITAVEYDGKKTDVVTYDGFSDVLDPIPKETEFKLYIRYGMETEVFTVRKEIYVQTYVVYRDSGTGYKFLSQNGETPVGTPVEGEKDVRLADDTAYISYASFMYGSEDQLTAALDYMATRGRTKLIFDLRGNGGGYMDVFQNVSEHFVDNGGAAKNLVALARYKDGREDAFYTEHNRYKNIKVVALADDNSASASECLLGAMLHYGAINKDTLVITKNGDVARTYGKGIMQRVFPHLMKWDAISLTTAYIYWPDKTTNIHGKGIRAEGLNAVTPSDNEETDNELIRATEILKNL